MSQPVWRIKRVLYEPPDYTANSVDAIFSVGDGYLIGPIIARTEEAFNGSGTAAIVALGDGDNVDEFMAAGEIDETTVGSKAICVGASDGSYDTVRYKLYSADDTIDVSFTANTSGTRTTGRVEFQIHWMRARAD